MKEESKKAEVPVTIEQEAESFTKQVLKDILPTIAVPDPILTLLGTLSILCNRIITSNHVPDMISFGFMPIKMEDKYYDQRVLKQLLEILNLPSEKVPDEENFSRLTSLIKLSFRQLIT